MNASAKAVAIVIILGGFLVGCGQEQAAPSHQAPHGSTRAVTPPATAAPARMEWKLLPGLFEQKGDHPVVNVSWYDAKAFCEWLSRKSGKTVVLPTEAQFEYACRTGTNTAYPWGNSPGDGKGWANCADQSCKPELLKNFRDDAAKWEFFSWDDGFMFTAPVGSFKANAFGLFDMIGNACQWCSDWYDKDYYANSPKTDPHGPGSGDYFRVVRGGGWQGFVRDCRSANRGERSLGARYEDVGFRVVMDVR